VDADRFDSPPISVGTERRAVVRGLLAGAAAIGADDEFGPDRRPIARSARLPREQRTDPLPERRGLGYDAVTTPTSRLGHGPKRLALPDGFRAIRPARSLRCGRRR
jgi:hypothetical protein